MRIVDRHLTSDWASEVYTIFRPLAQLVEQGPYKTQVVGSSPTGTTNICRYSITVSTSGSYPFGGSSTLSIGIKGKLQ